MIWAWRATAEWYIDGENRRTRRRTCPSATLSTTNPAWVDPDANPVLRGERPTTNHLSHGTALLVLFIQRNNNILVQIVWTFVECSLLGCDAVWSCRWLQKFRKKALLPSSGIVTTFGVVGCYRRVAGKYRIGPLTAIEPQIVVGVFRSCACSVLVETLLSSA
jgi:hypothetical protein